MSVHTWRPRRGLKGSATEDWLLQALAMQQHSHPFEPRDGRETCHACGLMSDADVHGANR